MTLTKTLPEIVVSSIEDYFATPVKTAANGATHNIVCSSLRKCEALALANIVYQSVPLDSLEIGMAEGGSCIAISAARQSRRLERKHMVLDPYQKKWTNGVGLAELTRLGLREQINWLPEYSENFLNAANAKGDKFDFVFVDGGHDLGQKLTDAFYIAKVLRPGGTVAFHDGLFLSTSMAVRHLVCECGFQVMELPPDDVFKRLARSVRHAPRLGSWYATQVMPKLCLSLVAMQKPA